MNSILDFLSLLTQLIQVIAFETLFFVILDLV